MAQKSTLRVPGMLQAATVRRSMVVVKIWRRQDMEGRDGDEEVLDKITVKKLEGRAALRDGQMEEGMC